MNDMPTSGELPAEILIAEDSPTQSQRLQHILTQQGYRVVAAANGRLALEAARRRKPALIISDVTMPEMDGYQLCSLVKADNALKDVPFILVTSLSDPSEVIRGLECGADSFILKPYVADFLAERVQSAILNRGTPQSCPPGVATEFIYGGTRHLISISNARILDVLMSVHEAAMRRNKELAVAEENLRANNKSLRQSESTLHELNARLEQTVAEQTAELREATRRHLTLLGNLQGMAYRRTNDAGRSLEFVSEGSRGLLGVSPDDFTTGRISYPGLIHADDLERIRRRSRDNLAARVPCEYEYRVRHSDGSWRWVWEKSRRIYNEAGEIIAMEGFIADVTERVNTEGQLREAQRMDAISRLTGGLAHDLNNYLTVIMGNLDLLSERPTADLEAPKLIEGAIGGAERGAELTRSLLAFSRRQPLDPRIIDAGARIGEVVKLLRRGIGEKIVVEFAATSDLWPIEIDGAQLDSCIVNLANNARDAMPKGGRLSIVVSNAVNLENDAPTGDHVLIELGDSGSGMSAETVAQVFEPFFTTKEVGHGTGLGLSMVHGFVYQSGGTIRIDSELGRGTTVRIYLPRVAPPDIAPAMAVKARLAMGGGETILVVEDNDHVRPTAVEQLVALGYKVIEVNSGDAALAQLERESGPIDLVFTDLVMPGKVDGYTLARLVRERWPEKKVLLTSGFAGGLAEESQEAALALRLLRKPYRKADLATAISDVLTK